MSLGLSVCAFCLLTSAELLKPSTPQTFKACKNIKLCTKSN